jgi:Transposase IS66 family
MWCYVGDRHDVVFRHTPRTGVDGAVGVPGGRTGYVQADAANVFDRVFNGRVPLAIEVGCWSHARRFPKCIKYYRTQPSPSRGRVLSCRLPAEADCTTLPHCRCVLGRRELPLLRLR